MNVVLSEFPSLADRIESSLLHSPFMYTLWRGQEKIGHLFDFFPFAPLSTPLLGASPIRFNAGAVYLNCRYFFFFSFFSLFIWEGEYRYWHDRPVYKGGEGWRIRLVEGKEEKNRRSLRTEHYLLPSSHLPCRTIREIALLPRNMHGRWTRVTNADIYHRPVLHTRSGFTNNTVLEYRLGLCTNRLDVSQIRFQNRLFYHSWNFVGEYDS